MKMRKFKLGELFCGPGGMAIASARAGVVVGRDDCEYMIEHTWGVDLSKDAIETFKANLGEENGICMDAWEFVNGHLDERHRVDALAFGFPCNSFSAVGEQQGFANEKFGKLYRTGIRVLERYDCQWFVAENVSGIMSVDGGRQFKQIISELERAGRGYVVTPHLYKFEEYGVPQARHRYVIVGIRRDIAERRGVEFRVPAPTHGVAGGKALVTCREALEALDDAGKAGKLSERVKSRLKFIAPGENAWMLDRLLEMDDERLERYLRALPWYEEDIAPLGDLAALRAKIEAVRLKCKAARMSHIYRRLDPERPAYTLTGSGGGGTHVYHWKEHRALTNAERSALQTFPKGYKFCGTQEQVRRQIGMAVPTRGAMVIFRAILKSFAKIHYRSI